MARWFIFLITAPMSSIASCEACGVEFGRSRDIAFVAKLLAAIEMRKHGRSTEGAIEEGDEFEYYVEGPPAPTLDTKRGNEQVRIAEAPPQSAGAFVSGDGGYQFEVVGESHYQADLERIVGGRNRGQRLLSMRCDIKTRTPTILMIRKPSV